MEDEQAGQEDAGNSDRVRAARLGLGVGAVSGLLVLLALHPLLVNLYGPFGEHAAARPARRRWPCALVVGAVVGLVCGCGGAPASVPALVVLVGGLVALAVVAFPVQVDRHESFVERPNERSSCAGVAFRHYPPDTSDANVRHLLRRPREPLPAG